MKKIAAQVKDYFIRLNKPLFLLATIFTAAAIFINYHYGLNKAIGRLPGFVQFAAWYGIFLGGFAFGYFLQMIFLKEKVFHNKMFASLLLIAPAIFAWKMTAQISFHFSADSFENQYWNAVVYWPIKVATVTAMVYAVHRFFNKEETFYGVTLKGFDAKPYLLMLLIMVPLVAAASTQPDFLRMYPRLQKIEYLLQPGRSWERLLYELSYGSDFFSIELFFRGFLVLAFAKWVGKDAILPMAIFYCFIHFGKPLGECISSYFGGLILGVVSYHSRSIIGGFVVHVGIAWLMELGGSLRLFSD